MKLYNICGCGLVLSGIIVLIVGVINIPSEMPPIIRQNGESQQEASDRTVRDYNQSIINSKGFLLAMIGTGFICLSIISLVIMIKRFNDDMLPEHLNLSPRVPSLPVATLQPKPYITIIRSNLKSTGKNESKVKPTDII